MFDLDEKQVGLSRFHEKYCKKTKSNRLILVCPSPTPNLFYLFKFFLKSQTIGKIYSKKIINIKLSIIGINQLFTKHGIRLHNSSLFSLRIC